jgi:hypothetical protein
MTNGLGTQKLTPTAATCKIATAHSFYTTVGRGERGVAELLNLEGERPVVNIDILPARFNLDQHSRSLKG